ncbi:hypothetical protein ABIC16_002212 [Sphingomonas sp. PvP055]|uniref:DUF1643 domain-containing protein n=1 Tax=Sphingomonas sp. PvP055 TaxID=3156391 RepID=UPI00339362AD
MKTLSRSDLSGMECTATFSDDEAHRYSLSWIWDRALPPLVVCMLNPSTATHEELDPTIAGLVKRARAWAYGGVVVVNLFALRATDPRVMKLHPEPIGPENDEAIRLAALTSVERKVALVAAWGAHGRHLDRERAVLTLLTATGARVTAFQINADGTPKHPLYVGHDIIPEPWNAE